MLMISTLNLIVLQVNRQTHRILPQSDCQFHAVYSRHLLCGETTLQQNHASKDGAYESGLVMIVQQNTQLTEEVLGIFQASGGAERANECFHCVSSSV